MILSVRLLVAFTLVAWCCGPAAADPTSVWEPYGPVHPDEAAAGPGATPYASDEPDDDLPERRWLLRTPTTKVSWPRFKMPERAAPNLPRPSFMQPQAETDAPRNAWAHHEQPAAASSPLSSVANGARRVGDGARSAWQRTVSVFTPSRDDPAPRTAQRPAQPSLWQRMFGRSEPEDFGPQTVPEWMAQGRPDR